MRFYEAEENYQDTDPALATASASMPLNDFLISPYNKQSGFLPNHSRYAIIYSHLVPDVWDDGLAIVMLFEIQQPFGSYYGQRFQFLE